MLRKFLIGAGAVTLAASTSFAAGFDINDGEAQLADISSGTVSVDDCTDDLLLDVVNGAYDAVQDDWPVASIAVTSAGGDLIVDCLGFQVSAAIETGLTPVVTLTDVVTVGTLSTLALTPASTVWVSEIVDVAVLVDEPNLVPPPAIAGENGFNQYSNGTSLNSTGTPRANEVMMMRHHVTPVWSTTNGVDHFTVTCGGTSVLTTRWVTGVFDLAFSTLSLRSTHDGGNAAEYVVLDASENLLHRHNGTAAFTPAFASGDTIMVGSAWCITGTPSTDTRNYVRVTVESV